MPLANHFTITHLNRRNKVHFKFLRHKAVVLKYFSVRGASVHITVLSAEHLKKLHVAAIGRTRNDVKKWKMSQFNKNLVKKIAFI